MNPSEILENGLERLKQCEEDPNYTVSPSVGNMQVKRKGIKPLVFVSGAVMAKELGARIDKSHWPREFPAHLDRLESLNYFSKGEIYLALRRLGYLNAAVPERMPVRTYGHGWEEDMQVILQTLKGASL